MSSQQKGRALPKFGEWDANNPASAEGFTVIFAKARDEKKATKTSPAVAPIPPPQPPEDTLSPPLETNLQRKKWCCCCF